jgi:hypothetical protein
VSSTYDGAAYQDQESDQLQASEDVLYRCAKSHAAIVHQRQPEYQDRYLEAVGDIGTN